ncbi:MAG: hypothetical protein D6781_01145 [Verrucomicrobia bacterium]|nr:MAG: hypothetical protein D6781_01145 [Verrucomicrobiota bacterium]
MNKAELVTRILEKLREELRLIEEARAMANEEALPADDIAESQRENRALENQFLVDGQSRIVNELKEAITAYETLPLRTFGPDAPVALTALVRTRTPEETSSYFLGPFGGGIEIDDFEGTTVYVITPQSPLGRSLVGKRVGERIAINGNTVEIEAIA